MRVALYRCPHCGRVCNSVSEISGDPVAPRPDDFTICIYCAGWMVFTGTEPRLPTPAEYREIAADLDCQAAVMAVQRVIAMRATN